MAHPDRKRIASAKIFAANDISRARILANHVKKPKTIRKNVSAKVLENLAKARIARKAKREAAIAAHNVTEDGTPLHELRSRSLERRAAEKHMYDILAPKMRELAQALLVPAMGQHFIFRIDTVYGPKGGVVSQKHVQVVEPKEMAEALDKLSVGGKDPGGTYFYITAKEPDPIAIDKAISRVIGRPRDPSVEELGKGVSGIFKRIYDSAKQL